MDDHGRLHGHHRDDLAQPSIGDRQRSIALTILCLCALTAGVDMTVTNVALPFIGDALDAPTNELQWTVDSYNIMLAGLLVLGGALADRHGRRRIFLLSYALFGVASALAAFSSSAEMLIAARALMGVGAAGFTAPALAIIASMYPPEERSGAIAMFVGFGAAGLAIGPIVGGLLLDAFWWGSVFLVNVLVVAVGVIAGSQTIPESRAPEPPGGRQPLDVLGALMSVAGLAGFLYAIIEGPNRGWLAPSVVIGLVGGAAVIALFVVRELRSPSPLFDVRILARPVVAAGSMTLLMAYVLFNAFLFLVPQYLQDVEAESIVTVGLLLVPFAVVFGACSQGAQAVLAWLGPGRTIPLGLLITAISSVGFVVVLDAALWLTVAVSLVFAVGMSLLIAPPSTVVMNDLPPEKAGDGSSLNFVSRFVGASVGIAIVGSILATVYARDVDPALASLSADEASEAQGSLQGALEVATELSSSDAADLAATARSAFDSGAAVAFWSVAVLAAVSAVVAWFALRRSGGASVPSAT